MQQMEGNGPEPSGYGVSKGKTIIGVAQTLAFQDCVWAYKLRIHRLGYTGILKQLLSADKNFKPVGNQIQGHSKQAYVNRCCLDTSVGSI